jgi:L-threonylcarbamoyladenylate synthase
MTEVWKVDATSADLKNTKEIQDAAKMLQEGEVVAFPTETVYGLGANALSEEAVAKIYEAKGRPSDNPLIIHISNLEQIDEVICCMPYTARKLTDVFWPGPLTVILPKSEDLNYKVTGGLETVAVRMPDHPISKALIEVAGVPIAAPSANLSGKPSPTEAGHVLEDMDGRVAGIVDGGPTGVGVESTVIDTTSGQVVLLRPGSITRAQLEEVLGDKVIDPSPADSEGAPKSPGMKYRHYSPQAPLQLVPGGPEELQKLITAAKAEGKAVGVLATEESAPAYRELADVVSVAGERSNLETVAHSLYNALRNFDHFELDVIYSEVFPAEGIGEAIMNRLTKAAGSK